MHCNELVQVIRIVHRTRKLEFQYPLGGKKLVLLSKDLNPELTSVYLDVLLEVLTEQKVDRFMHENDKIMENKRSAAFPLQVRMRFFFRILDDVNPRFILCHQ